MRFPNGNIWTESRVSAVRTFLVPSDDGRLCLCSAAGQKDGSVRLLGLEEVEFVVGDWDSVHNWLEEYFARFEATEEQVHRLAVEANYCGPHVAEAFVEACQAACAGPLEEQRSTSSCPGFSVKKGELDRAFESLRKASIDTSAVDEKWENVRENDDLFRALALAIA
jgi:hypothetical protein